MIKPAFGEGISKQTYDATIAIFEDILKILHPFMPFLSEEIWHLIGERGSQKEALVIAAWPKAGDVDEAVIAEFELFSQLVSAIRNVRKENNLPFKEALELKVKENEAMGKRFDPVTMKLCNLTEISKVDVKVDKAFGFLIKSNEYYIPMSGDIDIEAELEKIKQELDYTKGFLNSVSKKLSNERFVSGAPEQVVAAERKKMEDAESKIKVLEEKLASLN
jgi:valyl-tRNA synthetase